MSVHQKHQSVNISVLPSNRPCDRHVVSPSVHLCIHPTDRPVCECERGLVRSSMHRLHVRLTDQQTIRVCVKCLATVRPRMERCVCASVQKAVRPTIHVNLDQ